MSRRAAFLDRDGVINAYAYNAEFGLIDSPSNPDTFTLLPGVSGAIAELNRFGLLTIVVSNQPGIAKGKFSESLLSAMTVKMEHLIGEDGGKIDGLYYCLHHPDASREEYRMRCECRKPASGLLLCAARDWDIDLEHSYTVGDGIVDILAGQAAGTTTLFVSPQKCYICDDLFRRGVTPDYIVDDLSAAVKVIGELEAGKTVTTSHCTGIIASKAR